MSTTSSTLYLTDAQLRAELDKCEYCEERPCLEACPCHCSPADFIMAARCGEPSDLRRAAALIMGKNPLGGVCGLVCPDHHCMAACVHGGLDSAVNIPAVQGTLIKRAKDAGVMPQFAPAPASGKHVAVVGAGPAGLAAAALLGLHGHRVTILDRRREAGGMCRQIPPFRLDHGALDSDLQWLQTLGELDVRRGEPVTDPRHLAADHDAVVVAAGLWEPIRLGVPGEELTVAGTDYLDAPGDHDVSGAQVMVVGGGATAFDCAMTALHVGAARVEMLCLENPTEMPLSADEMRHLLHSGIDVTGRTRVEAIRGTPGAIEALTTCRMRLRPGVEAFSPDAVEPVPGATTRREDVDQVIIAIGNRPPLTGEDGGGVFFAGDCVEGPTTVVEAAAAGKNAGARAHAFLTGATPPAPEPRVRGKVKSRIQLPGHRALPVPLECDFFGRTISSPFLLSAAPPTDGLEQMRAAYEAGWSGAIMKTAFDGVPIHIPSRYMFTFDADTYANCDNVSSHPLDRVCREIEQLVREYPDRLTIGSTGGPVTGDDEADRAGWQGNTLMLERAGAMGIEYSLSCPQGGDGTEGDIVSQNARLTAKIVEWVLAAGDGQVPKLFKLTGAVTSVAVIVEAIREVLQRHPDKRAGVTLANTFPTLVFRPGARQRWDEGIVVGMSGLGALHISYLTLAKVAHLGVSISGNGGPMDYRAAANFLALGARTVQFCTIVMKYGYRIFDELCAGLSHLMEQRGLASVEQLIGVALPDPITDFMDLPAAKLVSQPDPELCLRCGNCTRCPYLAISAGPDGYPVTDPARCVGCSICALKCFAGAISMRERTPEEAAALTEA